MKQLVSKVANTAYLKNYDICENGKFGAIFVKMGNLGQYNRSIMVCNLPTEWSAGKAARLSIYWQDAACSLSSLSGKWCFFNCTVVQISPSKRQSSEQQASLKAAIIYGLQRMLCSSIASPICQEGQSERTFPILAFSSQLFLFILIFSQFFLSFFLIFSLFFPDFWQFFHCQGRHSAPLAPILATPLMLCAVYTQCNITTGLPACMYSHKEATYLQYTLSVYDNGQAGYGKTHIYPWPLSLVQVL